MRTRCQDLPTPRSSDLRDEAAFDRFLAELRPRVLGFLRSLHRQEAEDLLQETYARAWRSRARVDGSDRPASWLLRIAFRAFLDFRSKQRPAPAVALDEELREGAPGPVQQAVARERSEALLSQLPPREREILLRFHRDGQSIAAIAAALALPAGTVKSHLHRARQRLWDLDPSGGVS